MKLTVKQSYKNGALGLNYKPGTEIEVSEEKGRFLLQDAPGCFEIAKPKRKQASPRNKAVKAPKVNK